MTNKFKSKSIINIEIFYKKKLKFFVILVVSLVLCICMVTKIQNDYTVYKNLYHNKPNIFDLNQDKSYIDQYFNSDFQYNLVITFLLFTIFVLAQETLNEYRLIKKIKRDDIK